MKIGVPKETQSGETRVALVPSAVEALRRANHDIMIEVGAGVPSGSSDADYEKAGAQLARRAEVFAKSDVLLQVRTAGANPQGGPADLELLRHGQVVIGLANPLLAREHVQKLATAGVTLFALELLPRISRAQSMDVLSSMANLAGYKAVLLAAHRLPKIFPMMMTAAGTISPARVLVLGAGVAGLQAIATAKRLGAVVEGYDIRPEVKEQVESVGGKFVELPLEEAQDTADTGGYAKAQSEDFYKKQQELLARHVQSADVVITTAAIPGRRAPILLTEAMLEGMRPGSIIVDLAAETGGNCALTKAGEEVSHQGITICGPTNVPATLPHNASQLYSKNITNFLSHITEKDGTLKIDLEDAITKDTLVTRDGQVVHARLQERESA